MKINPGRCGGNRVGGPGISHCPLTAPFPRALPGGGGAVKASRGLASDERRLAFAAPGGPPNPEASTANTRGAGTPPAPPSEGQTRPEGQHLVGEGYSWAPLRQATLVSLLTMLLCGGVERGGGAWQPEPLSTKVQEPRWHLAGSRPDQLEQPALCRARRRQANVKYAVANWTDSLHPSVPPASLSPR